MGNNQFKKTIDWYNKNASHYSKKSQGLVSEDQIDEFVSLLPANPKILDAGCASGRDSNLLTERSASVIGIDISEELIKIAKEKYPEIYFVIGNFLQLPFADEEFYGVWSHASLLHFDNKKDVITSLSEFFRVLKKNGIIHIVVKKIHNNKKFEVVDYTLTNQKRFFQYFSLEEMSNFLKEVGFRIIKTETVDHLAKRNEVKWLLFLARK